MVLHHLVLILKEAEFSSGGDMGSKLVHKLFDIELNYNDSDTYFKICHKKIKIKYKFLNISQE